MSETILQATRADAPGTYRSPTAHLVPRTDEEKAFAGCEKISKFAKAPEVREMLGIPSDGLYNLNEIKWKNISAGIKKLQQDFDFSDPGIATRTQIGLAISEMAEWRDCISSRPVWAYVDWFVYRELRHGKRRGKAPAYGQ